MNFLTLFTLTHVAISLVGIGSGFFAFFGSRGRRATSLFLWSTLATSVTGFLFPFHGVTPAHIFGVISLVLLALAFRARRTQSNKVYAGTAVAAFYLNFFVLIVQSFQKIPALRALAPTQTEPAFAAAQLIALVGFLVLGVQSVRNSSKEIAQ